MLTAKALSSVYGIRLETAELWLPELRAALRLAGAETGQREACFLAQVGHESGCLRYTSEIWGPTPQQERYEGTSLALRLGNVVPGDGYRYRGRGLIQVSGRSNYASMGKSLGIDLIADPAKLRLRRYAAVSAAMFWKKKRLNSYCDKYDFVGLTKAINGGTNGLAHRQALYTKALLVC